MLIECLTRREGPSPVDIGKIRYLFQPIPGISKPGIPTASICEVNMEEHIVHFLKLNNFRLYDDPKRSIIEQREYEKSLGGYEGFSIQKYQDKGYIVVDQRDKKNPRYADSHGQWRTDINGLSPFTNEFSAWEFLKEAFELGDIEEPERPEKKQPEKKGAGRTVTASPEP